MPGTQYSVLGTPFCLPQIILLSRWEETVLTGRDAHGRLPFSDSVAHRQGFLDRPLVDEYALILREWLKARVES